MLNIIFVASMCNCAFDERKKAFFGAEMQSLIIRDIIVGNFDVHTVTASVDFFAPEKVQ